MQRGGARPGAGRKPGVVSNRTAEAVKSMAPIGERALGVLVEAMENLRRYGAAASRLRRFCAIVRLAVACNRYPLR
jgi:hypothetical protein